ncbi:MAG: glycosyltransferase family 39 protein [Sphaerospermopsis sp. SIO1G2]|nr:glycosyltransferase family 39 protein [Sphaerospermopsis sp. SIO1G2]
MIFAQKNWLLGLLIASLCLWLICLGNLPLRDWDEGTIAQVAHEIWRSPAEKMVWLYPTLGGEPYHNKPPLIHWLIAFAYSLGGVNEWTTRLPSAILTALGVPLFYLTANLAFQASLPALFSALVYMTMLPVVRHGRLAMLDGAIITFFIFLLFCILKSRHQRIYALGIGVSLGLITMTKGIIVLLLGGISFLFIIVNQQIKLLKNLCLWLGILLGSILPVCWYFLQWKYYGNNFLDINFQDQSFARVFESVEGNSGPIWYYLIEIIKYGFPWLFFLPGGLYLAWQQRRQTWSKLVLIGTTFYFTSISFMSTKLPWYVMPIYPFFALAIGAKLMEIWQIKRFNLKFFRGFLNFLIVIALGGCIYFTYFDNQPLLILMSITLGISMLITSMLVGKYNRNFILTLFIGMYLVLLLLMSSESWIWELNEAFPVKPVAELIRQYVPAGSKIYTSFRYSRPSLDFYSNCQIIATSIPQLQEMLDSESYLLVENESLNQLNLNQGEILGKVNGFTLVSSL